LKRKTTDTDELEKAESKKNPNKSVSLYASSNFVSEHPNQLSCDHACGQEEHCSCRNITVRIKTKDHFNKMVRFCHPL
jgi:hypothetical protein